MGKCPHLSYLQIESLSDGLSPPSLYTYKAGNDLTQDPFIHFVECIQIKCEQWDSINSRCGKKTSDLVPSAGPPNPAMDLISEFMGGSDLDGNNLIYGKDFKISDGDDKPPILKTMETKADWIEPSVEMTWADYLASL